MINFNMYTGKKTFKDRVISYLCSNEIIDEENNLFELSTNLFRYSGINEYVVKNLKEGTITLTNPILFNDLYDGILHLNSFEKLYKDEKKKCNFMEMLGFSNLNSIDVEILKLQAEREDKLISQTMRGGLKIGCLSQTNKSILMWSHYADKNQGICIEYDLKNSKICPFVYPVIYKPNPIDFSRLCNTNLSEFDIDMAVFLSTIIKNNVWEYEEEWRIVFPFAGKKNTKVRERIDMTMPKPKAIYLGKNFLQYWINEKNNKKDMDLFDDLCKCAKDNDIPLYIMKNKLMSYEIYPEMIDVECVQRLNEDELYDNYLL